MNWKYKSLLKDSVIFAIGNMGSKLILFLLVPLYTNFLTTEEYGISELIFSLAQLIVPFLTLSINEAILRFGLINNRYQKDVILNGAIVFLISSFVALLITPCFQYYSAISKWRWYLSLYVISFSATLIFTHYLKAKEQNKLFAIVCIIQTAALAILNVILIVVLRIGIKGYLISNIVAHFIAAGISFYAGDITSDLKKAHFDKSLFKDMIVYSSPLVLSGISWWIIHSSDKIMIEKMIDPSSLGIYTVATKIPSLLNVVITIFSQAWGISSIKEIESTKETGFFNNIFSAYSLLLFLASILLIAIIKPFMKIYVGADFSNAWVYVPFLLVSAVFFAITAYFAALFAALKKSLTNMISTLIAATTNIVINYFGIKMFGLWGAVMGTVSAYVVMVCIGVFVVRKSINLKINYISLILNTCLLLASAFFGSFSDNSMIYSVGIIIIFIAFNYSRIRSLWYHVRASD